MSMPSVSSSSSPTVQSARQSCHAPVGSQPADSVPQRQTEDGSTCRSRTRSRTFALTPPARDVLLALTEREGLVFRNKTGGQLTQLTLTAYWKEVKARARASTSTWRLSTTAAGT
jgi:hypothetical protein